MKIVNAPSRMRCPVVHTRRVMTVQGWTWVRGEDTLLYREEPNGIIRYWTFCTFCNAQSMYPIPHKFINEPAIHERDFKENIYGGVQ